MPTTIEPTGATPFPIDAEMTAIAQHYFEAPGAFIADRVLPAAPRLRQSKFEYRRYRKADAFRVPDTRLGRTSEPQQVEFSAEKVIDETIHYGLRDMIPVEDQDAARLSAAGGSGSQWDDPASVAVVSMTHLLRVQREKRVADLVFAARTYDADYRQAVAADDRWSNDTVDPLAAIETAINLPLLRPNIAVFGQAAWSAFRRNPKVVDAVYHGGTSAGLVMRQQAAEILEVDEVLVGRARIATSAEGKPLALSRMWGKSVALIYRGAFAAGSTPGGDAGSEGLGRVQSVPSAMPTFGFTAVYEPPMVRRELRGGVGIRGATAIDVVESCKEVISGGDGMGYLLSGVVA